MTTLEKSLGKRLTKNISLKKYSTFKIGGPAKYFYVAKSVADVLQAVTAAKKARIPFVTLGSGANVLISDKGVDGLVVLMKLNKISISGKIIQAEAGVNIGTLSHKALMAGLTGLECWSGIPGTVGGAIYGNMGLPQVSRGSVADWLSEVTVLRQAKKKILKNIDCRFGYRDSIFKHNDDIILEAKFSLHELENLWEGKKLIKYYQTKKMNSQPVNLPSTGCIFKNPLGHSAGQMIDDLGLKGKTIGQAQVSEQHGNFINNLGQATASEVVMLISLIKQKVRDRYHLQLEEEINYIGFN